MIAGDVRACPRQVRWAARGAGRLLGDARALVDRVKAQGGSVLHTHRAPATTTRGDLLTAETSAQDLDDIPVGDVVLASDALAIESRGGSPDPGAAERRREVVVDPVRDIGGS